MDNDHVFSASEETSKEKGSDSAGSQKLLIGIGVIILILGIGTGSYLLGRKSSQSTSEVSPTPSDQLSQIATPTPTFIDNSPTPVTSISGTLTPTKKPSVTVTPTVNVKSKIISAASITDGFESSNGGGNTTLEIRAGRNANLVTRGFVSFDLSDIPSGVTVKEATLRLYQAKVIGNPYTAGGSIKVDHLTYGDSLDNSDYSLAALSSSFITLTSNATLEWKDADVTDRVKDDLANARSRSQYRIHFQTETTGGDVTGDFAYFEAAENTQSSGNPPQLVVKYY